MDGCPICQHAKIQAISAALARKRLPNVIRAQYRLDKDAWDEHLRHSRSSNGLHGAAEEPMSVDEPAPPCPMLPPLRRFKQAWQDAKDDRQEQQRMVNWLNEQLSADEMGL